MKNSNYIVNGILAAAIIVLFILQFTGRKGVSISGDTEASADSASFRLPVAYIRTDSLLTKYKFSNDLNEAYIKKVEDKNLDINKRGQKLQKEIVDFYQKAQNNAFISQERLQQEQTRLEGMKQDLDKYTAQVEQELYKEQMKLRQQQQDTIIGALKQFNTPKKYQIIFSNADTDNILYADDIYDITNEVIEFLNARYVSPK